MSRAHEEQIARQPRVRRCWRETITRVIAVEGDGRDQAGVVREVEYLYDDEGTLIARVDPYPDARR